MKVSYGLLLAAVCSLFVGSGRAEAYIGYGYRANEPVKVDRCYRGHAWNYAVPFYVIGANSRYYRERCLVLPERKKKKFK